MISKNDIIDDIINKNDRDCMFSKYDMWYNLKNYIISKNYIENDIVRKMIL